MDWIKRSVERDKCFIRNHLYLCTANAVVVIFFFSLGSLWGSLNLACMLYSLGTAAAAYIYLGEKEQIIVDLKSDTKAWKLLVEYEET